MFGKMKKASAKAHLIEALTERCANFQLYSNQYKTSGHIVKHQWEKYLNTEQIINSNWPAIRGEMLSKLGEKLFVGEISELCDVIDLINKNVIKVLQTVVDTPSGSRPAIISMAQARIDTMEYLNPIVQQFINYDLTIEESKRGLDALGGDRVSESFQHAVKSGQDNRDNNKKEDFASEEESDNFFEVDEEISTGSTEEADEKISDGSEFSLEIESDNDEIEKEDASTGDDVWNVATTYYDNLESLLDKVRKLDVGIGKSFKQKLISSKEFENAEEIAEEFINNHLSKSLPVNLVELAKASMVHDEIFCYELLKAITMLGASSIDKILTKLAINHTEFARAYYDLHEFRALLPEGVETLAEETKRLEEEEVKRFDSEAKRLWEEAHTNSIKKEERQKIKEKNDEKLRLEKGKTIQDTIRKLSNLS